MSEISQSARIRLIGGAPPASPSPPESAPPPPAPAKLPGLDAQPAASGKRAAPLFHSDAAEGADVLEAGRIVQPLAHLCVSAAAQTPFLAAIAGPVGAGKTFALRRLSQTVETLAASPGALARVVVASVDAADGAEAPVALAAAAYAALARDPGGVDTAPLLEELASFGSDPLRGALAASERHEEAVRRLEAERANRDEAEARSARLADALLFETPGSRVDVYVRARRGAIDSRLRRFDLAGADSSTSFRDLVRDMASMGPGGRIGAALRAIWAFPGQRRLLFWAVAAFILAFAVHLLHGQDVISAAQPLEDGTGMVATSTLKATDWVRTHGSWFETAAKVLTLLGALALALNLWRAIGFASLIMRGAQLLNVDVRDRRRDLDTRVARLNQRVAALTADAEAAARRAEAAARRVGGNLQTRAQGPDFLDARNTHGAAARGFLAALGERIGKGAEGAPDRLIFVIDNLDAMPPPAAAAWIDAAHTALGAGTIGVLAFDPARLVRALGGPVEARRRFDKWLQVVVNLPGRSGFPGERLIARLLSTEGEPAAPVPDPAIAKALAEPLSGAEASLLAALAPLAAGSPRAAKRFVNAYRLARCSDAPRPAIALMQAVAFADEEAQTAMRKRLLNGGGDIETIDGPEPLVQAVRAARAANGGALLVKEARAADAVARRYALSLPQ